MYKMFFFLSNYINISTFLSGLFIGYTLNHISYKLRLGNYKIIASKIISKAEKDSNIYKEKELIKMIPQLRLKEFY